MKGDSQNFPKRIVGWKVQVNVVSCFDYPADARGPGRMKVCCLSVSLFPCPCPLGVSSERSERISTQMTGRTRPTGYRLQPTLPCSPLTIWLSPLSLPVQGMVLIAGKLDGGLNENDASRANGNALYVRTCHTKDRLPCTAERQTFIDSGQGAAGAGIKGSPPQTVVSRTGRKGRWHEPRAKGESSRRRG